jgi:hypothetical protein
MAQGETETLCEQLARHFVLYIFEARNGATCLCMLYVCRLQYVVIACACMRMCECEFVYMYVYLFK